MQTDRSHAESDERMRSVGSSSVGLSWWRALPMMRAALAGLCVSMNGCVEVTSYKQGANFDAVPGAIPYILSKTNFVVTATYTLNCVSDGSQWKAQIIPSTTISATSVRDDNEKYYIKSDDLKSLLKDSQITIGSNANQTLASVNGTVNDLVGPTIATAIGVGVSAAGAGSLAGITPTLLKDVIRNDFLPEFAQHLTPPAPKTHCGAILNEDTGNALDELISLRKAIDNRQAQLAAKGAVGPGPGTGGPATSAPTTPAPIAPAGPPGGSASTDQLIAIWTSQAALVTAQHLTVKTTFQWAPDPKKDVPDPNGVITRMLDATSIIRGNWFAMDPNIVSNDYIRNFSTLPLVSTLQLSLGPGMYVATGPKATDTSEKGLVLRTPAVGTLRLCGGASCATNDATNWTDATQTIAELDEIGVAQYGKRIIMPFRNVVLQNTSVTIALAADGTITSLGTHDQSIGNSVLGTVGTDVQGVASAYAARNTAIGAANTATQNAVQWADTVNKALADCLAQQKAIIQAGVTPTTSCQ